MKKKELLEVLKRDDGTTLSDWLIESKGDFNLTIFRKPLIEHALNLKADHCTNVLLLHGAWTKNIRAMTEDKSFLQMINEIEEDILKYERRSYTAMGQILDELSRMILGNHPFSFRDILTFEQDKRKEILCGLHLFEYANWDFLKKAVHGTFKCTSFPEGKFALVVSSLGKNDIEGLPEINARICGFLRFQEVSIDELPKVLDKMKASEEELFIGIHFSEKPIIMSYDDQFDLPLHFFDSMKETISKITNPPEIIFHDQKLTIRDITHWDDELHLAVVAFQKKHGVYPHILLASSATYGRIDMVANARYQERIKNRDGKRAEEFVSMSGFRSGDYQLDFCVDEKLPMDTVKLIFDSHPA